MKITTRKAGDVTILDLSGRLVIGGGDFALRDAVQTAFDDGSTKVLLNMAGVATIDSSGVGELVSSYTRATSRGGRLKLLGLPRKIQDILVITQLITVFEVFDDEAEAVASFA